MKSINRLVRFFLLSFWITNVFCIDSPYSDMWASVSPKIIRESHYQDFLSTFSEASSGAHVDLFFRTNWYEDSNPKVFGDFIASPNSLNELLFTALPDLELVLGDHKPALDALADLISQITLEDITLGGLCHVGKSFDSWRAGCDIPLLFQVSHIWTSKDNQERLAENLENIKEFFPQDPNANDLDASFPPKSLSTLVEKKVVDSSIGDLRLYLEKDVDILSQFFAVTGVESFLPVNNQNTTVPSSLKFKDLNLVSGSLLANHWKNGDLENLSKDVGLFLENIFHVLHETKLRSQVDQRRFGFGLYVKPEFRHEASHLTFFGLLRGGYFFPTRGISVIPIQSTTDQIIDFIELSAFQTKLSAVHVAHAIAGVGFSPGNFEFKFGYDFFYRSKESILEVISSTVGKDGVDYKNNLKLSVSEAPRSWQHRGFASLSYRIESEKADFLAGVRGFYNFDSSGITKDWGAGFGLGFSV